MKASKKIDNKLADRIAGFQRLKSGKHESKVEQRINSGGFTMPGSRKKG